MSAIGTPGDWIRPLTGVRWSDAAALGAKAAGLGEATAAGERVPPGFVLTPAALATVLKANGLTQAYAEAIARARKDDFGPAAEVAGKLERAVWPPDFQLAVMDAAKALGDDGRFAVRASATQDDAAPGGPGALGSRAFGPGGEGAAYAHGGLHLTELDVAREGLNAAVCACWASALSAPVLAQTLAQGRDPADNRLALVVQLLVVPEAKGLIRSLIPGDARRTHMQLVLATGEVHELPRRGPLDTLLLELLPWLGGLRALLLRMEDRLPRALELSFAVDQGPVVLQLATLPGDPPGAVPAAPIRWSRDPARARFPLPLSPLSWSLLRPAIAHGLAALDRRIALRTRDVDQFASLLDGQVHLNEAALAFPDAIVFTLRPHLPFLGSYLALALRLMWPPNLLPLFTAAKPGARPSPLGRGPRDPRFLATAGFFRAFVFTHARQLAEAHERDFAAQCERLAGDGRRDFSELDDPALRELLADRQRAMEDFTAPVPARELLLAACRRLVEQVVQLVRGEPDPLLVERLALGVSEEAARPMHEALRALQAAVAADAYLATALRLGDHGAVPAAWARSSAAGARDAFLGAHGHLTDAWDLRQAPLIERPYALDAMLAEHLRAPEAPADLDADAPAREAALEQLVAELAAVPWAQAFVRELVAVWHTALRHTAEHRQAATLGLPYDRHLLAEAAKRAIARGALAEPDEVFFLTREELLGVLSTPDPIALHRLAVSRRTRFEQAYAVPAVVLYEGQGLGV